MLDSPGWAVFEQFLAVLRSKPAREFIAEGQTLTETALLVIGRRDAFDDIDDELVKAKRLTALLLKKLESPEAEQGGEAAADAGNGYD